MLASIRFFLQFKIFRKNKICSRVAFLFRRWSLKGLVFVLCFSLVALPVCAVSTGSERHKDTRDYCMSVRDVTVGLQELDGLSESEKLDIVESASNYRMYIWRSYLIYRGQRVYDYETDDSEVDWEEEGVYEITVYLHDEFDEFTRRDKPPSFIKLFCGTFTLFFFKIISSFCFAINLSRKLYRILQEKEVKKESFTNEDIKLIRESAKFNATNFLRFSGIFFKKRRLPDSQVLSVYQKYFGPDYKIEYEGKFSCYICNHTSFNDILLYAVSS